jgi:hypothetical protein
MFIPRRLYVWFIRFDTEKLVNVWVGYSRGLYNGGFKYSEGSCSGVELSVDAQRECELAPYVAKRQAVHNWNAK